MLNKIIDNWHYLSVYIAGALFLVAALALDDPLQKVLVLSAAVLFLHFFEEFGWPGGFPFLGVKVMLGSAETDSAKWDCNNLNSMFGNWLSVALIYLLPAFLPNVKFLVLGAMVLSTAELVMHLVLFNVRERTLYNPGFVTAVFGLVPLAVYFFMNLFDPSMYVWYDYVLAVVWFAAIFWLCFRSPLYWNLGKKEGYPLTDRSAYGSKKPVAQ